MGIVDVTYGNISEDEASWRCHAANDCKPFEHEPGDTETYISRLVADFVIATGALSVLETGAFRGATTAWILQSLGSLQRGHLTICEIDPSRTQALRDRFGLAGGQLTIHEGDVLQFLRTTDQTFDLCWLDDSHEERHVRKELELLYPKMRPGALILMHDVCGVCPGNQYPLGRICNEFGGYVLNIGRMGPAGGLGLIAIPQ